MHHFYVIKRDKPGITKELFCPWYLGDANFTNQLRDACWFNDSIDAAYKIKQLKSCAGSSSTQFQIYKISLNISYIDLVESESNPNDLP